MFLQAEMRAAVFLAMDEQDKLEVRVTVRTGAGAVSPELLLTLFFMFLQNKTPLINENLKKSLLSRDGESLTPPTVSQVSGGGAVPACQHRVELWGHQTHPAAPGDPGCRGFSEGF